MRHLIVKENMDIDITSTPKDYSLTRMEADELDAYCQKQRLQRKFIIWGNRSIRFINYVGFIQCPSFSIDILPKLAITGKNETNRHTLLMMLDEVHQFKLASTTLSRLSASHYSLFHLFVAMYTETLLHEFKRGMHSQYRSVEQNIHHIKGKLHTRQHLKQNILRRRPHHVYCTFSEHSHNNIINQLFLATNLLLVKHINHRDVLFQLQTLNHHLYDVDYITFHEDTLAQIHIDRTLHRYQKAIHLAILFQQHFMGNITIGKKSAYALLFDMAELYEQYIATLVQRYLRVKVTIQDQSHALFKRKNQFAARLYPDLVIQQENQPDIIIDTKWKAYHTKYGINEADLAQMYKYLHAYKHCDVAYVLYPQASTGKVDCNNIYEVIQHPNKQVIAETIPLINKQASIDFLQTLVSSEG